MTTRRIRAVHSPRRVKTSTRTDSWRSRNGVAFGIWISRFSISELQNGIDLPRTHFHIQLLFDAIFSYLRFYHFGFLFTPLGSRPASDRSCAMTLIAGVYLSSHSDSTDRRRRHVFFSPSAMALWHCDIRPRVIHAVIWFGQRRHARQAPDNKNDIKVIGVCDLPTHVVTYLSHRWFPTARYRYKPRKAMGQEA